MGRLITNTDVALDTFDVIVVGATEAGCFAARQAADAGATVLLTSDMPWFGWMSSGYGLNQQDCKGSYSSAVIGGMARRFLSKLTKENFSRRSFTHWWKVEGPMRPEWSKRAFRDLLTHPKITLLPNTSLVSLVKTGTRITSLLLDADGVERRVYPRVVVEGTACGDVNQKALTSISIGREANSLYGETGNGIMTASKWDNNTDVDPYVTPGDAGSGLLFGVDPGAAGTAGAGDGRVMGFCYRMFLTSVEPIAWATFFGGVPPADYNPLRYELLGRAFAANPTYYGDATNGLTRVITFYNLSFGAGTAMGSPKIPSVDANNLAPMSLNYPVTSELIEYISANPARRAEIREAAKNYQLGLFYWLLYQADARIPATIRTALGAYGFSYGDLAETGGFSGQFYEREGARAVGDLVLNQTHVALNNLMTDAVAFGFYDIDGHTVRRLVVGGLTYVEGANLSALGAAYGFRIPMRVLLPKEAECSNLVCASQPSVSHVIWRSIRVAPSMMMIGTAGGALAALAARLDADVHDVSYENVAAICDPWDVMDGTVLDVTSTYGHGTITDTGAWTNSASSRFGGVGATAGLPTYATVGAGALAGQKKKFAPNVYGTGLYDVFFQYSADISSGSGGQGRATNLQVKVVTEQGTVAKTISQQVGGSSQSNGGRWEPLGRYQFRYGVPSADYVEVDCTGADGQVTASAIKLVPVIEE